MAQIINPSNYALLKAVIGILVQRAGGQVNIAQEDFDKVAGFKLAEGWTSPESFVLAVTPPDDPTPYDAMDKLQ